MVLHSTLIFDLYILINVYILITSSSMGQNTPKF